MRLVIAVSLAVALTSCGSNIEKTTANDSAASKTAADQANLVAMAKAIKDAAAEFNGILEGIGQDSQNKAEAYSQQVRNQRSSEELDLLSDPLYREIVVPEQIAARASRENAIRDRAANGLKKSLAVLNAAKEVNQSRSIYLNEQGDNASLSALVNNVLSISKKLARLKVAMSNIGSEMENAQAIVERQSAFRNAVKAYNIAAVRASSPLLAEETRPPELTTGSEKFSRKSPVRESYGHASAAVGAPAFTSSEKRKIAAYTALDTECRDDPDYVEEVCNRRDAAALKLATDGLCWGTIDDEASADYHWHRCTNRSVIRSVEGT